MRAGMRSSPMAIDAALGGLFVLAFLSATVLPGTSELTLAALVVHDPSRLIPAIAVATLGNTLGGLTSYAIGRLLPRPATRTRALTLAERHGVAALLFSWVPIIGDALCVASGWLRHELRAAAGFMAVGKLARYIVVAYATHAFAA